MREIRLIRHGLAEDKTKNGERYLSLAERSAAVAIGRRFRSTHTVDFSVIATSPELRARRTAEALGEHIKPQIPEIIVCDALREISDAEFDPELTHSQITTMLYNGMAPRHIIDRGHAILDDLANLDDRIGVGVTHGKVIAATILASMERDGRPRPGAPSLIVPNLGSVAVNIG